MGAHSHSHTIPCCPRHTVARCMGVPDHTRDSSQGHRETKSKLLRTSTDRPGAASASALRADAPNPRPLLPHFPRPSSRPPTLPLPQCLRTLQTHFLFKPTPPSPPDSPGPRSSFVPPVPQFSAFRARDSRFPGKEWPRYQRLTSSDTNCASLGGGMPLSKCLLNSGTWDVGATTSSLQSWKLPVPKS